MKKSESLMQSFEESRKLFAAIGKRIQADVRESMSRDGTAAAGLRGLHSGYDFHLMDALHHLERAKLKEIAEHIGAKPLVCLHLRGLEQKKFVVREPDENDRRNVFYRIGPKGQEFLDKIHAAVWESADKILGRLDAADSAALAQAIKEVNRFLRKVID